MTIVRVGDEWINHFHNDSCNQNNLSYRAQHARGFCDRMRNHGHTWVFDWGDDNAWERDFRHPDFGGDSFNWTDNVHFCYYSNHGGNWDNIFRIAFAVSHDHCLAASSEWKLGTKMMKWLVLDCCDAVLNTTVSHILAVWFSRMRGIHLIFGFVGLGHDSWWNASLGEDFGEDAGRSYRLSNSWLDHAYSFWLGDTAIAIAAGETQSDAINRRENETIDWRFANINSTNWLAWKWRG